MRVQLIRYHDIGNINTRLAQSLNKRQGVLPPLGLAFLASSLEKARHKVEIIDAIALELSKEQVRNMIKDFSPEVVGITAMTPSFKGALEVAEVAKEEGAETVLGGVHLSLFPEETLSYDVVDFGMLGEAEDTMLEFLEAFEKKSTLENISGLAYKKHGKIFVNPARIVEDLNKLPMPAYHLLPMEKYFSIIALHPISSIMASRGCPYRCSFCYKTPSDKKYRTRSVSKVVDEMEYLTRDFKVKEIMFYDDLMLPGFARQLCEEILARNLKIKWQTPQRINLVNRDLLKLMARAGCRMLRYGVEQGDPRMLKAVKKNVTIEQVKQVFQWTHEVGIDTFAYFIIGCADENTETIQSTINLAKELNPRFVMFTKAVPLPQTELMDLAVNKGLVSADYWKRFSLGKDVEPIPPFVKDTELWVKRAYREFYFRPKRILQQLAYIRSAKDLEKSLSALVGLLNFRMR